MSLLTHADSGMQPERRAIVNCRLMATISSSAASAWKKQKGNSETLQEDLCKCRKILFPVRNSGAVGKKSCKNKGYSWPRRESNPGFHGSSNSQSGKNKITLPIPPGPTKVPSPNHQKAKTYSQAPLCEGPGEGKPGGGFLRWLIRSVGRFESVRS